MRRPFPRLELPRSTLIDSLPNQSKMIDAHFHCWQLSRGDYGWLNPALNPALQTICRNVSVLDWQVQSRPLGVRGGVLVQAAPTEAETLFLLEQADSNPAVLGVVGWVDLLAPQAPARIRALAQHPMLKGLRPMLHDLPDPAWILQPALRGALEAMTAENLVFDALVKPPHLPPVLTLAQRHPGLQIVIDHVAKPGIAASQWQPWADSLTAIARQTNVFCKLSGLLTEAVPNTQTGVAHEAIAPYAEHALAVFGADRLIWGSDWPVLELSGLAYAHWLQMSQKLLQNLPPAARAAVLGGNAQRVYRL